MTIRVVIPSRYASTRLPGKPLIDLLGLPMVVRVYQRVVEALPECDCLVALDDTRISQVLDEYDIPWVMTRVDHESGTDRIAEVCRLAGWDQSDIVINVQGDEPLIPKAMLGAFVDFIEAKTSFEMGTISAPVESLSTLQDSNVVKVVTSREGKAIYFSRFGVPFCRDVAPESITLEGYKRHIGVYAYRVDVLSLIAKAPPVDIEMREKLEQLRALWLGVGISVMDWFAQPPHGVDTPEDVKKVISVLKDQKND